MDKNKPDEQPMGASMGLPNRVIHRVRRWDVMQGTVDAAPGEPTYTVKVRAHCGQIAIEFKAPARCRIRTRRILMRQTLGLLLSRALIWPCPPIWRCHDERHPS